MDTILNLGSGVKVSAAPEVVNIDWSPYMRLARNPLLRSLAPVLLDPQRRARLAAVPKNVRVHNLKNGIPWPTASVDAVYHSHLLEHLDREFAIDFMREVRRVLRPGGFQRIVVPDLERAVRDYLADLELDPRDRLAPHDESIAPILEQSVRRSAYATRSQPRLRRTVETVILGDARRRGETHQWMYDAVSLRELLTLAGYTDLERHTYETSSIPSWERYGLDCNSDRSEYKPGSLYMEARRPQ